MENIPQENPESKESANPEKKPEEKKVLSLKEYLDLEREEMHSPENMFFAWQALGHSPSYKEAEMYYVEHGGATGFAERHILKARLEAEKEKAEKEKAEKEKKESEGEKKDQSETNTG